MALNSCKGAVTLALIACNNCISLSSDWSEIFKIIFDQSKGREMQILHANIAYVYLHSQAQTFNNNYDVKNNFEFFLFFRTQQGKPNRRSESQRQMFVRVCACNKIP